MILRLAKVRTPKEWEPPRPDPVPLEKREPTINRVDRLADRSVRMTVETRTELSVKDGHEEKELSVVRELRYDSERE